MIRCSKEYRLKVIHAAVMRLLDMAAPIISWYPCAGPIQTTTNLEAQDVIMSFHWCQFIKMSSLQALFPVGCHVCARLPRPIWTNCVIFELGHICVSEMLPSIIVLALLFIYINCCTVGGRSMGLCWMSVAQFQDIVLSNIYFFFSRCVLLASSYYINIFI